MILVVFVLLILLVGAVMTAWDLNEDLQRLRRRPQRSDYVDQLLRRAKRRVDETAYVRENGARSYGDI